MTEIHPQKELMGMIGSVVATRLKQVAIDVPEDAVQIFGRRTDDGATPIVITPKRSTKVNTLFLILAGFLLIPALILAITPDFQHLLWSWFLIVFYWPLILVFLAIGLYPLMTLTIPSGVYALMTKHGRYIGLYDAGRHFLPPWYKIAYMVTRQSTAYNAPVKNCPTLDNVMVKVDLLLVFHIEDPEAFVYKLGTEKFDDLLVSSAEEAIRGLVRSIRHDSAYELRGKGAGEMISGLSEQFKAFGVVFTSASITNVELPHDLAMALENQTTYESKKREQEKRQQYELQVLNDKEALSREELNKRNERLEADETAKLERQQISKQAAEIEAEKDKRLAEIAAAKEASVLITRAEGEFQAAKKQAEALKVQSEAQAGALRVQAEAEAAASRNMQAVRQMELEAKRLEVLQALAQNGHIVISGNNGDNILAQITAATRSNYVMSLAASALDNGESQETEPKNRIMNETL